MKSVCCYIAVIFTVLSALTAAAAPSPWDSWRSGYTNCERAEEQAERGNYTEALSLFEQARSNYIDVRTARPDWNQRVIAERIAECDRRMNQLKRLLGNAARRKVVVKTVPASPKKSTAAVKKAEPVKTETAPVADEFADNSEVEVIDRVELEKLRRELAGSKAEVIKLRAANIEVAAEVATLKKQDAQRRSFEQEIANLVRDRRVAREKYALLEARCKNLEAELAKPGAQIELLQNRLLAGRSALENERKRAAAAEAKLKEVEEQVRQNIIARTAAEKVLERMHAEREKLNSDSEKSRRMVNESMDIIRNLNSEIAGLKKHNTELTDALKRREKLNLSAAAEAEKRIADLEQNIAALQKRIETGSQNITKLETELARQTAGGEQERNLTAGLRSNLEALQKNNEELQLKLARLQEQADSRLKLYSALEQEKRELISQLEASRKFNEALQSQITRLNSTGETGDASKKIASAGELSRFGKLKQELAEAQQKAAAMAERAERAGRELAAARENLAALEQKNAVTEKNSTALEQRLTAVENNLAARLQEIAALNATVKATTAGNEQLKQQLREKTEAASEAERNKNKLAAEIRKLASEAVTRDVEAAALRKEIAGKESDIAVEKQKNNALIRRIKTLEKEAKEDQENRQKMEQEFARGREALAQNISQKNALAKRCAALEDDLKQLSARAENLAARLKNRDSEDYRSASSARETCRKLEKDILTLQNELVELRNVSNSANLKAADFERQFKSANAELTETRRRENKLIAANEQLNKELARLSNLEKDFAELKGNFEALNKENRQNRTLLAAAKPREKELDRIKLRLLELDRLKAELVREQQLNEELRNEGRRLNGEVKLLRSRSAALDEARRKIAELEGVVKEVEQLRVLKDEYAKLSRSSSQLAALKIRTGDLENQLNERSAKIRELESALSGSKQNSDRLEKELQGLHNLRSRNQELAELVAAQNRELEQLNSQLAQFKKGDPDAVNAGYLRQIRELKQLADRIAPLNDQLAAEKRKHESVRKMLNTRITRLQERCETADAIGRRRDEELARLRKLNSELAQMNRNSAAALESKVELAQLKRLESEVAALNKLYADITAERDRLAAELDAVRRGVAPESTTVLINESPEELAAAGLLAERKGNMELALWNYRQALLADSNFRPAHLRLGELLFARKDYAGALPHLSASRSADMKNIDLAVKLARCQIALKRFGNAKAVIEPLLKQFPEKYQLQLTAGLIESGSGSASAAEQRMVTASRQAPDKPEVFIELAKLLCESIIDRKGEAVRHYERARALGAPPVPELEKKLSSLLDSRREMIRFLNGAANEAVIGNDHRSAVWYYRKLAEMKSDEFTPRLALALHRSKRSAAAREVLEFSKPTRLGMAVLTIIESESGNDEAAVRAARQSAGAAVPEDWSAMALEINRLKRLKHPSAAIRIMLSGFQK